MIVTLLSDFGTQDGFVGAMKGVIVSLAPDAQVVDLTHDIAPQDIWAGAWALREAAPFFPRPSVHVAVVDPGVGTARRPILVEHDGRLFVGPDNGLLSLAAPRGTAWHLDREELFRRQVSRTFHGRDIFAAVAGHLAAGVAADQCGTPIREWLVLELPSPSVSDTVIEGVVLHADRFGNLVTNITGEMLSAGASWSAQVEGAPPVQVLSTFGDVPAGQWVAYVGSSGYVEMAVRDRSAEQALGGAARHRRVTLCIS